MRHFMILAFWAVSIFQANSQTVANSIFAEYGYVNIPKEAVRLYALFGSTKYTLYADDAFIKIESFQYLPQEKSNEPGPALRTVFVKERATDEIFMCLSIDTLNIRMKGGDEEGASFKKLIETFNSGNAAVRGKGTKKTNIQGFNCSEILVKGKFSDTISAFVTNQIVLAPGIKDFPLYVANGDTPYGLLLGRNEVLKNNILEFRAVKLEINKPKDLAVELKSFHLVSKDEGDRMVKAVITKLMVTPGADGKN